MTHKALLIAIRRRALESDTLLAALCSKYRDPEQLCLQVDALRATGREVVADIGDALGRKPTTTWRPPYDV